jgi:hypothetical protein
MNHISKPHLTFLDDSTDPELFLSRKIFFHGTGEIHLKRKTILRPSILFSDQRPHNEVVAGSFWQFLAGKSSRHQNTTSVYFGAWLRTNISKYDFGADALIGAVRLDIQNTFMTFTFDVNVSSLSQVTFGYGGPEFSIIQIVDFKNKKRRPAKVKCPDFLY